MKKDDFPTFGRPVRMLGQCVKRSDRKVEQTYDTDLEIVSRPSEEGLLLLGGGLFRGHCAALLGCEDGGDVESPTRCAGEDEGKVGAGRTGRGREETRKPSESISCLHRPPPPKIRVRFTPCTRSFNLKSSLASRVFPRIPAGTACVHRRKPQILWGRAGCAGAATRGSGCSTPSSPCTPTVCARL